MVGFLLIACIILGITVWVYKSKYDNENWLRTKCENELNKTRSPFGENWRNPYGKSIQISNL